MGSSDVDDQSESLSVLQSTRTMVSDVETGPKPVVSDTISVGIIDLVESEHFAMSVAESDSDPTPVSFIGQRTISRFAFERWVFIGSP
jgi:hypothetical protein